MPDKSINASRSTETPIIGEYFSDMGSFVDGIVAAAGSLLGSRPNNGHAKGINPQDSLKTRIDI